MSAMTVKQTKCNAHHAKLPELCEDESDLDLTH